MKQVAIIDYGMGNIWSVKSAFEYIGAEVTILQEADSINKFEYLVLPGVGSFRKAMDNLQSKGFDEAISKIAITKNAKILGICLGMQLMGTHSSEDGLTEGLGLIPAAVSRFDEHNAYFSHKIPHIGFNTVIINEFEGLFSNLPKKADFYFVHSYRIDNLNIGERIGTCSYGEEFLAAFESGLLCGTQFHPEKSQTYGLQLLTNFLLKI